MRGPFRPQVGRNHRKSGEIRTPAKALPRTVQYFLRQFVGRGAKLHQAKCFSRTGKHALCYHAVMKPFLVTAPTVKNVVVIPHHQRWHPRQYMADLRLPINFKIMFQIEFQNTIAHLGGEIRCQFLLTSRLFPGDNIRMASPDPVGINLVPAMQKQGKRPFSMFAGQINPQRITIRQRSVQIAVFLSVTRDKPDPKVMSQIGIHIICFDIETVTRIRRNRQLEIITPVMTPEPVRKLCRGYNILTHDSKLGRIGSFRRHNKGGQTGRFIVAATREQERAKGTVC